MKFVKMLCVFGMLFAMIGSIKAETFPNKPVKIIINLPVGTGPDALARRLAEQLRIKWQQPVVVENRPGAAGLVALEAYLREPADGYTIYIGDAGNFTSMPILNKKENLVQQVKILAPIYLANWVVIAPKNIGSYEELKQKVGNKPFYGSWGVGSSGHLCGAELGGILKVNATHIPYKDFSSWFTDLVNGQMSYSCASIGSSEPLRKDGKLNYLAITSESRDPDLPEVPTIKELTGQDFKMSGGWIAAFIHQNAPATVTKQLEADLRSAIQTPEVMNQIKALRGKYHRVTNAEFDRQRQQEFKNYQQLIKNFGITIGN
jgi:tripartite-type tricarboxylate transporter receptor subunit TctC